MTQKRYQGGDKEDSRVRGGKSDIHSGVNNSQEACGWASTMHRINLVAEKSSSRAGSGRVRKKRKGGKKKFVHPFGCYTFPVHTQKHILLHTGTWRTFTQSLPGLHCDGWFHTGTSLKDTKLWNRDSSPICWCALTDNSLQGHGACLFPFCSWLYTNKHYQKKKRLWM